MDPSANHDLDPRDWRLGHWLYALLFALAPKRTLHGITVASSPIGTHDVDSSFHKLEAALATIARHDPPRYAQLKRNVPRIWIGPIPNYARGQWIDELRLCMLRDSFVADDEVSASYVAALLVHEATHARMRRRGIPFDEKIRPRVERACIKSQLAFARTHPSGAPLIPIFEENLRRADSWWSDGRLRSVQLRALKRLGAPRPLRRLLDRFSRNGL